MRGHIVIAVAMKVSHLRCVSWMALLSMLAVVYGDDAHCPDLVRQCEASARILGTLTSDRRPQNLMCRSDTIGQFVWYRNGSMPMVPILPEDNKYVFSGQNNEMLTVMNVEVNDEGLYFCRVNDMGDDLFAACLLAYVPAEFRTCPSTFMPRVGCTEVEVLDATTENQFVQFQVNLTHEDVPSSCYNQVIDSISFNRKGTAEDPSVSITTCLSTGECIAPNDKRYTIRMVDTFNIVIKLVNLTTNDSGDFFVQARLREAGRTERFCIYKNFTLRVTVPTTEPPTEPTTTAETSTSSDQPSPLSDGALAAIVVVFVVLFIPLVILAVVVVVLICWTCYRRQQEVKKSNSIYEDTDQAMKKNGSSIRMLLGQNQQDTVSQNEAEGVGELNHILNSEDTGHV